MTFRLLIECTKDIDKLSIDFSDGTSMVQHTPSPESKPRVPRTPKEKVSDDDQIDVPVSRPSRKNDFLDTDAEFGSVSQEVVPLPSIPTEVRPVKVAEELQNMNF